MAIGTGLQGSLICQTCLVTWQLKYDQLVLSHSTPCELETFSLVILPFLKS